MELLKLFWEIVKDIRGGTLAMTRKTANTLITAAGMNTNMSECEAVINGGISATNIEDAAITAAKLGTAAVETAKIKDANVTTDKIADANVTTAKIADANVTAAKLASDAVETAKIKDAAVTTAKILDANVTNAKLAGSIDLTTKVTGTLPLANGGTGQITAALAYDAIAALGTWTSKSTDTVYLAATDGFVCACRAGATQADLTGLTDASNPPTTQVAIDGNIPNTEGDKRRPGSIMFPVKKGHYWKVNNATTSVYWIPMGA